VSVADATEKSVELLHLLHEHRRERRQQVVCGLEQILLALVAVKVNRDILSQELGLLNDDLIWS